MILGRLTKDRWLLKLNLKCQNPINCQLHLTTQKSHRLSLYVNISTYVKLNPSPAFQKGNSCIFWSNGWYCHSPNLNTTPPQPGLLQCHHPNKPTWWLLVTAMALPSTITKIITMIFQTILHTILFLLNQFQRVTASTVQTAQNCPTSSLQQLSRSLSYNQTLLQLMQLRVKSVC